MTPSFFFDFIGDYAMRRQREVPVHVMNSLSAAGQHQRGAPFDSWPAAVVVINSN
jgi:hypothetical protein